MIMIHATWFVEAHGGVGRGTTDSFFDLVFRAWSTIDVRSHVLNWFS